MNRLKLHLQIAGRVIRSLQDESEQGLKYHEIAALQGVSVRL